MTAKNITEHHPDGEYNMKKITSFTVDHTKIDPGLFISRKDGDVTTYDMRVKKPNANDYMSHLEMHSFEHMFATYVRNSEIAESVLYFGPMGCQTGFYLLVRDANNETVLQTVITTLERIIAHDGKMFGESEIECGNYRSLSVEAAKEEAKKYLATLKSAKNTFEYPTK